MFKFLTNLFKKKDIQINPQNTPTDKTINCIVDAVLADLDKSEDWHEFISYFDGGAAYLEARNTKKNYLIVAYDSKTVNIDNLKLLKTPSKMIYNKLFQMIKIKDCIRKQQDLQSLLNKFPQCRK